MMDLVGREKQLVCMRVVLSHPDYSRFYKCYQYLPVRQVREATQVNRSKTSGEPWIDESGWCYIAPLSKALHIELR